MALNTGINSLDADAPDITYTGKEGPQDPRMASAYLGDKYIGMQDLVDEFKQRHGYDPLHDMNQWFKFLEMKRNDPEARLQERDTRTASAPNGEPFMMEEFLQAVKEGFKGDYDAFIDQIDKSPADYMAQGGITGTYTQRRRNQMAGGGIMGSNAGSMLVAPTADGSRPGYGWLDDVIDWGKEKVLPTVSKYIAPAAKYLPIVGDLLKMSQAGASEKQPIQTVPGPQDYDWQTPPIFPTSIPPGEKGGPGYISQEDINRLTDPFGELMRGPQPAIQDQTPGGLDWRKALATVLPFGDPGYVEGGLYNKLLGLGGDGTTTGTGQGLNIAIPMGIGAAAGAYQKKYLEDQPPFPGDET